MKQNVKTMTIGGIASPLIRFAIPLFLGSIFQQLYSTADFLFVGNLVGKSAAAAVSAGGLLVTCLIGLFTGLSAGAGITVAQHVGAGDRQGAQSHMESALFLAFAGGLVMLLLGEVLAVPVLKLLHTPKQLLEEAVAYIRLYFVGMLPMILYNIGSGILRACGDSASPFYILIIGGVSNVMADYLMIGVLGLGVRGAALATTVSQGFSAVLILHRLHRGNEVLQLRSLRITPAKQCMLRIIRLGIPAGVQSVVITLSNIIVQYFINGYGEDTIAAFAAYFKLENLTYFPVLAFGQAAMTFVGQNAGAQQFERVKKGIVVSALLSCVMVTIIAGMLLLLGEVPVGWFIQDEQVIQIGLQIMSVTFPVYWLNSLIEVFGGSIRGLGYPGISMVIILSTLCLIRTVLIIGMNSIFHTVRSIACVYPLSWGAAVLTLSAALFVLLKRHK